MPQCAVATCRNSHRKTKGRKVRYHRFPSEDEIRKRWVSICGRSNNQNGSFVEFNTSTARVCSLHFSPNSYERDVEHELLGLPPRSRLKRGAVTDRAVPVTLPSLIGKMKQQQHVTSAKTRGKRRQQKRRFHNDENNCDVTDTKARGFERPTNENEFWNGPFNSEKEFDVLKALGLIPAPNTNLNDNLNRMHIMEDKSKTSILEECLTQTAKCSSPGPQSLDLSMRSKNLTSSENKSDSVQNGEEATDSKGCNGCDENKFGEGDDSHSNTSSPELKIVIEEDKPLSLQNNIEFIKTEKLERSIDDSKTLKVRDTPGTSGDEDEQAPNNEVQSQKDTIKRSSSDSECEAPDAKKFKLSIEDRERTVSDYIESVSGSGLEELQRSVDKIQQEIHTLSALAQAKEHEWNSIIRMKKLKEEIFLRLQRRKQVLLMMMGPVNKMNESYEWDLTPELRSGECYDLSLPSTSKTADIRKENQSKFVPKMNTALPNLNSQLTSSSSNVLKNPPQVPLMMVPIVSSGPGSLPSSLTISSTTVPNLPPSASLRIPEICSKDKFVGRINRPILPKPSISIPGANGMNGQNSVIGEGRQGPILDVKSIIADYRSRHPETVPRRGRRLKSSLSPTPCSVSENLVTSTRVSAGGGIYSMASLALGSGSQVRTGLVGANCDGSELGFLLTNMVDSRQEMSRPSSADSSRSGAQSLSISESASSISFKDVLVQFAKMSQVERPIPTKPLAPPPYPEVTLHPVTTHNSPPHNPSSSLLHGILTKNCGIQPQPRPTTFSPTLARLLTAPERHPNPTSSSKPPAYPGSHVSINDLLSTSKVRNELTITPVTTQQPTSKSKTDVVLLQNEQEDSADRLVIDESEDGEPGRANGTPEEEQELEDVPECQGCHQREAQFVCAGCGNQWYCSRECQVSAWDDHSEVCSG